MKRWYRIWEIIPGALTIGTLLTALILAFTNPLALTLFMLVFTLYWFAKILRINWLLVLGATRYKRDQKVNWLEKIKNEYADRWESLHHLMIIPTYKEDISILRRNINAIASCNYPSKKIIVWMAFEESDKERAEEYSKILTEEYKDKFEFFEYSIHPKGIVGEVRGKGPNITWAGRRAKEFFEDHNIPFSKVICTTLDADNRVDTNYLANLTWHYLNCDDPFHTSFQPIPMFFNNIWQVPLPIKIISLGSTFWQLCVAIKPHYARNFAAHAQPFDALIATDFWSTKTVVEDGHQYWRSFFTFHGNHWVVPIFVPIYMDAIQSENLLQTSIDQYLQRRRWYWGCSDIPYVFTNALRDKSIPFIHKWLWFARLLDSNFSLAVYSFLLSVGWLPFFISGSFSSSVLGFNFQPVYSIILTSASVGMVVTLILSTILVPPRPGTKADYIKSMAVMWILTPILLPVTSWVFSSMPAIDSQIRMMIGKPFTVFNVSKKLPVAPEVVKS